MLRRINEQTKLLTHYPFLGELNERFGVGIRRIVVGSYLVLYEVDEFAVRVVRVYHSSRNIENLHDD